VVDDADIHGLTLAPWEPHRPAHRRIAMLVDTDAIHAFGAACSSQADHLSAAATAMKAIPGPDASAVFGPVGQEFLATLAEAANAEAQTILALSAGMAGAHSVSGVVADAYADTDQRNSRLL
jgi:hypothetical protein